MSHWAVGAGGDFVRSIVSLMKRTAPSTMSILSPPGCWLEEACVIMTAKEAFVGLLIARPFIYRMQLGPLDEVLPPRPAGLFHTPQPGQTAA